MQNLHWKLSLKFWEHAKITLNWPETFFEVEGGVTLYLNILPQIWKTNNKILFNYFYISLLVDTIANNHLYENWFLIINLFGVVP